MVGGTNRLLQAFGSCCGEYESIDSSLFPPPDAPQRCPMVSCQPPQTDGRPDGAVRTHSSSRTADVRSFFQMLTCTNHVSSPAAHFKKLDRDGRKFLQSATMPCAFYEASSSALDTLRVAVLRPLELVTRLSAVPRASRPQCAIPGAAWWVSRVG